MIIFIYILLLILKYYYYFFYEKAILILLKNKITFCIMLSSISVILPSTTNMPKSYHNIKYSNIYPITFVSSEFCLAERS
jgi:hypothetical protein